MTGGDTAAPQRWQNRAPGASPPPQTWHHAGAELLGGPPVPFSLPAGCASFSERAASSKRVRNGSVNDCGSLVGIGSGCATGGACTTGGGCIDCGGTGG